MPSTLKLGYWKIRGLASNIRYQLAYSGVEYENVFYEVTDAPELSAAEWTDQKYKLGLDFPNIPYVIDGDFKLTETIEIHKYLAEKYKPELLGRDAEERAHLGMLSHHVIHLKNASIVRPAYMSGVHQDVIDAYKAELPAILASKGDKKFIGSEDVSYLDFHFFETLQALIFITKSEILKEFPVLAEYNETMKQLPGLKEYILNDPIDATLLFNNKMAKINGAMGF
jgi:glutathione S-transferase